MWKLFVLLLAFSWMTSPTMAERRVALVIGNSAYQHAVALKNATNDAQHVAATLRRLEFEVLAESNLDKRSLEKTLGKFARLAGSADVAIVYYSGHAIESDGVNYLLPVSADLNSPPDIDIETISLPDILKVMRAAGAKVQLVFLDACRNDPFPNRLSPASRSAFAVNRGLARVIAPVGSLVAFSTGVGELAFDGDGDFSPFTASFLQRIVEPKVEIRQMLSRIRSDVMAATKGKQIPWDNSSLVSDFYFVPPRPPPVFDRLALAQIAVPSGQTAPLALGIPRQPEGGELVISIETEPRNGRLILKDRELANGDRLRPEDWAELGYRPDEAVAADAFSFRVKDAWGNEDIGLVSLARSQQPLPSGVPRTADLGNILIEGQSFLGLGANMELKRRLVLGESPVGATWLRLISEVAGAEVRLAERKIDRGDLIQVSELSRVGIVPSSELDGREIKLALAAEEPHAGHVELRIRVAMHACDRLAGAPLDSQGVADGLLPNEIRVPEARPACEAAIKSYPGVARFHYQLGRVYLAEARNSDAAAAFEKAISLGHIRAHVALGALYATGNGVARDYSRARMEYEKAVAHNDVYALHALGKLLAAGLAGERDEGQARKLYETAARLGHTYAMNDLGALYHYGRGGVTKDVALARRYFEQGAVRNDMYSLHNLGLLYLDEGSAFGKEDANALTFLRRAAELGHPSAPTSIGNLYRTGRAVPLDLGEAVRWYREGMARGDAWATLNLGLMFKSGSGMPLDLVEAAVAFARAVSLFGADANRIARQELEALPRPAKVAGLRVLMKAIDPHRTLERQEAPLMQEAIALLKTKGFVTGSGNLDEILAAAALVSGYKGRTDLH